ncbi:hypothetical protein EGW08_006623 [Elysia chlorotica]|uniref:G-protein coupled receptors family 1 profile domain-containing protein n=1 Tax=Elysia chlorotica TaxID=188477 RepID=A0A3S1BPF7_ELYCH|nr:hypothetical protein EGW08_006623 [Elysia chlorotica]
MNLKATSTTLSLAVPFVICATPKVLTYMFLAFNPRERIKVESLTLLAVTIYLNVSNSLINPIVYCHRLPELRNQFMTLFGRRRTSLSWSSDEPIKPQRSSSVSSKPSGQKDCNDTDDNSDYRSNPTGSHVPKRAIALGLNGDVSKDFKPLCQEIKSGAGETANTPRKDTMSHAAKNHNHSDRIELDRKKLEEVIEPATPDVEKRSADNGGSPCKRMLMGDGKLLVDNEEFQNSREKDACDEAASSLHRKGGLKGDKGRRYSSQRDGERYKWLVDSGTIEQKSNRRKSDCIGQINSRFHSCSRYKNDKSICFQTESNLVECGKRFQSTPNFEENGRKLESGVEFACFKTDTKFDLKTDVGSSISSFHRKKSFTAKDESQIELGFPKTSGRFSPGNTEKQDQVTFQEHVKPEEKIIRKGSGDSQKSFSFKHIWKAWAASILAEAAKNLVYEAVGKTPKSRYISKHEITEEIACPWRFSTRSDMLSPPSDSDKSESKTKAPSIEQKTCGDDDATVADGNLPIKPMAIPDDDYFPQKPNREEEPETENNERDREEVQENTLKMDHSVDYDQNLQNENKV